MLRLLPLQKDNMELYKLNLPNGIVNNIVDYALGEEMYVDLVRNGEILNI